MHQHVFAGLCLWQILQAGFARDTAELHRAMRSPPWSYVSTTLPGIARHIIIPLSFRLPQPLVGNDGLPQRDPAVVCGHQRVLEHREAPTPQFRNRALQQDQILEGPAAEADAIKAVPLANPFAQRDDGRG